MVSDPRLEFPGKLEKIELFAAPLVSQKMRNCNGSEGKFSRHCIRSEIKVIFIIVFSSIMNEVLRRQEICYCTCCTRIKIKIKSYFCPEAFLPFIAQATFVLRYFEFTNKLLLNKTI